MFERAKTRQSTHAWLQRSASSETSGLLILLANLGVLAITVKLYTEILKDKRISDRPMAIMEWSKK
jgi:hypothetical protein